MKRWKRMVRYGGPGGDYDAYVRSLACVVPGCKRRTIHACHDPSIGNGGVWSDQWPGCDEHHAFQHQKGVLTFKHRFGIDLDEEKQKVMAGYKNHDLFFVP